MRDFEDLAPEVEAELLETARAYLRTFGIQLLGVTPQVSGDLADSYRFSVRGTEYSSPDQAAAAIRGLSDVIEVTTEDPAFAVLDLGVHLSKDGRRRGSPKAPRGLSGPAATAADQVARSQR